MLDEDVRILNNTQIKRDKSDSQSLTKVLYRQKPLQTLDLVITIRLDLNRSNRMKVGARSR